MQQDCGRLNRNSQPTYVKVAIARLQFQSASLELIVVGDNSVESMTYAITGIFSVHLTLAYGEETRSCERLLQEVATQKRELSF